MVQVPLAQRAKADVGFVQGANLQQVKQPDLGAAVSDVGASFGGVSFGLAKEEQTVQKIFDKAESARVLNNEVANASKNLAIFSNSLKENPDNFGQWGKQHEEFTSNVVEDARGRLAPDVFDSFNAAYTKSSTKGFIDTINASRKIQVNKGKSDLDVNLSVYNDLYATSPDPEDRKTILGQSLLAISDAQNTGIIDEVTATNLRDTFLQSVEETRLENDLNISPEATLSRFEDDEYLVSEESKPSFKKMIDTAVESEKRQRVSAVEKNELRQEKLLKQAQGDLEIDFRDLMLDNKLTSKEIINAGQSRNLSPTQVKSLLADLEKEDKVNSDPEEYDKTLKQILANELTTDQVLENLALSQRDKKTFTGMITTITNQEEVAVAKQRNEDEKKISAAIRPFIISTGPLAQFVKQDEQILYQSAIEEMRERLDLKEPASAIKLDIIERYSRVPLSTQQLPNLKFGSVENLDLSKAILVQKFQTGAISEEQAVREAEVISKYEEALRNQKQVEAIAKENKGKRN